MSPLSDPSLHPLTIPALAVGLVLQSGCAGPSQVDPGHAEDEGTADSSSGETLGGADHGGSADGGQPDVEAIVGQWRIVQIAYAEDGSTHEVPLPSMSTNNACTYTRDMSATVRATGEGEFHEVYTDTCAPGYDDAFEYPLSAVKIPDGTYRLDFTNYMLETLACAVGDYDMTCSGEYAGRAVTFTLER